MLLRIVLFVFVTTRALSKAEDEIYPPPDELPSWEQNSWETNLDSFKILLGAKKDPDYKKLPVVEYSEVDLFELPENFDPRDKWPNCPSLNEIRDQGNCGSCWAFGAVEAMTDRYCIYSNGTKHFHFSAEDLLCCCFNCSDKTGCDGGEPSKAYKYWVDYGIVSGGNYHSYEGCRPYELPPTNEDRKIEFTPKCEMTCETNYKKTYKDDKMFGKKVYAVKGEPNIRAEIFNNGPVSASFDVYNDFPSYQPGEIYRRQSNVYVGGHVVKIIGWGVEEDQKYWVIANSWNVTWGDKGFFRMVRGEDHCKIESEIIAGEPLYKS